jgi:cysteine desulfurase/selenocysteine lyase
MTTTDWQHIRKDFPILRRQVNGKPLVYFDNAATSQKPQAVIDALVDFYSQYNSNVHRGVHSLSQEATNAYEAVREKLRAFIGAAETAEVVFTKGTTDAINLVATSWGEQNLQSGDEILVSALEHHANLVPWQLIAEKKGAKVVVAPINESGELEFEQFLNLLNPRTKMVAISWISNALGTVNPVEKIIAAAHALNIPVLLDAAQAAPHSTINVQALNVDFLAFSAHKMLGPTGIGILYGKRRWLDAMPPYQGGGDMIDRVTFEKTTFNKLPLKFEAGTPNIADVIAFGAAIDYLNKIGLAEIEARENELLAYATAKIKQIAGIRLVGTAAEKRSVLSFVPENGHPYDVGVLLDQSGIAIRTGHHCAQPLMDLFSIPGTCRASFAFYNTEAEIDFFIERLQKITQMLQ